jgi:hypothetical protein
VARLLRAPVVIGFHVAPEAARLSILVEGLLPALPNPRWAKYRVADQPEGVYVWDSFERALSWAQDFHALYRGASIGRSDVWHVGYDGLVHRVDPILGDQGAFVIRSAVDPERLCLAACAEAILS